MPFLFHPLYFPMVSHVHAHRLSSVLVGICAKLHLNTAAGVLPASIIGHMQRMTVADKAPTAIFH